MNIQNDFLTRASIRQFGCHNPYILNVDGVIGEDMWRSLFNCVADIIQHQPKVVIIKICSNGGTAGIIDKIFEATGGRGSRKLITFAGPTAYAYSAGADLLLRGDYAIACPSSELMFHSAHMNREAFKIFNIPELEACLLALKSLNSESVERVVKRCERGFKASVERAGSFDQFISLEFFTKDTKARLRASGGDITKFVQGMFEPAQECKLSGKEAYELGLVDECVDDCM